MYSADIRRLFPLGVVMATTIALSACGAPESEPADPAPTPPPASAAAPTTDTQGQQSDPQAAHLSSEGQPGASERPDEAGQPEMRSDQEENPQR